MIKPIVRRKISINYQRKNVIMVPELSIKVLRNVQSYSLHTPNYAEIVAEFLKPKRNI